LKSLIARVWGGTEKKIKEKLRHEKKKKRKGVVLVGSLTLEGWGGKICEKRRIKSGGRG